ncbi:phage head spike fiber domain-containing protein [Spirosoma oryzicola]|uniref:phage head spike fiber domain-containing protein n=1 Tax=Spirosoma oryzicola TaxID=2898794 RepID=UPI001E3ABD3C|nr:hypothetical protein [Spirosoma oryzicola]UHG93374.1 hypothetical protein LQ777_10825 [Spirosoma oryzicola]
MVRHIGATVSQFTPSLNLDFMKGVLPVGLNFTRATQGTYFDSTGTLQTAPINTPRFDYDPVSKQLRGLLIEEQRTNFINFSNTLTSWNQTGATTTLLSGTSLGLNRYAIACGGQNWHRAEAPAFNLTSGTAYSGFILYENTGNSGRLRFVFRNQDGAIETVVNGLIGSSSVTNSNAGTITYTDVFITPTVRKFTYTYVPNYTGGFRLGIGPDSTTSNETIVVLAAQFEVGSFATSYIPTTTAAVTRSADMCFTNLGSWYNQGEGTMLIEFVRGVVPATNYQSFFALLSGSGSNIIALESGAATPSVQRLRVTASNVDQVILSAINNAVANSIYKLIGSWRVNDFAVGHTGVGVQKATSGNIPIVTSMYLGSSGGSASLNGYLRKCVYYPRRLSNSYLQALTA